MAYTSGGTIQALDYNLLAWGGNTTTENVNARHFINVTWVSRPIAPRPVSEEDLFSGHWAKYGA